MSQYKREDGSEPQRGDMLVGGGQDGAHYAPEPKWLDLNIDAAAAALKGCAETFSHPVRYYVEPEALSRWRADNPDRDDFDCPHDDLESWRILARAALAAAKAS